VHCGAEVLRIEAKAGCAAGVTTSADTFPADLVIMAAGHRPRTSLARQAGLEVGASGGILVNQHLQTSDPRIYACGDCVENFHLVTGKRVYLSNGSLAARQGRVVGTNLAGGADVFPGVVGTFILKAFEVSVGGTGLTLAAARQEGFDALAALVSQADQAQFYPGQEMMCLQVVVDRPTRRVLGLQGFGRIGQGVKARLDAVAGLLPFRPTLNDLANLEVGSSPPFAPCVDILNTVAHVAENALAGRNRMLPTDQFLALWERRDQEAVVFLDTREPDNAGPLVARWGEKWLNLPQGELRRRLPEVPRHKPLLLICNSGLRSYEAQIILDQAGITQTQNLNGGLVALKKAGLDLLGGAGED
jgi:rhodanese-related sulfurtransferase